MNEFKYYADAATEARKMATRLNLDVFIRYNKLFKYYWIGLASKNGNDYAMAEIVRPGEPL